MWKRVLPKCGGGSSLNVEEGNMEEGIYAKIYYETQLYDSPP